MPYITRLFGASLFVTIALLSCSEGSNLEGNETNEKILDTNAQIERLKADSLKLIKEVIGFYASLQGYKVEYAEGIEVEGTRVTLSIRNDIENKLIAEYNYTGDQPYGCTGIHTTAQAEISRIEKIDNDIYKLYMLKTSCDYNENGGCDVIEFIENRPKTDNEFVLTIRLQNEITIQSTALKSKCKKAWDFTKLTFQRLPII